MIHASQNLYLTECEYRMSYDIIAAPDEPTNVTVNGFGTTWIYLSWLGPIFTGVPEFSLFVVSANPVSSTATVSSLAMVPPSLVTIEVENNTLKSNITDLFPGEEYALSVMAVSEATGVRASSNSSAMVFVITNTSGK